MFAASVSEIAAAILGFALLCAGTAALRNVIARPTDLARTALGRVLVKSGHSVWVRRGLGTVNVTVCLHAPHPANTWC